MAVLNKYIIWKIYIYVRLWFQWSSVYKHRQSLPSHQTYANPLLQTWRNEIWRFGGGWSDSSGSQRRQPAWLSKACDLNPLIFNIQETGKTLNVWRSSSSRRYLTGKEASPELRRSPALAGTSFHSPEDCLLSATSSFHHFAAIVLTLSLFPCRTTTIMRNGLGLRWWSSGGKNHRWSSFHRRRTHAWSRCFLLNLTGWLARQLRLDRRRPKEQTRNSGGRVMLFEGGWGETGGKRV